ncbi:MAG TPA: peptidase [Balneola sp.]|nr:peptidase [Balneola sp.]
MSNIDWDFIGELEGKRKLKGYVPDAEGSKSGVTIATGFDLGARNLSDLAGLPQDIIDVLTPYLGIKGAAAADLASELIVDDSQAKVIDEFSHNEAVERLSSSWESKTGTPFSELPMGKATTIASVAFQYGDLASKAPNFWEQVTTDDWDGAVANLRNFGDNYKTRRNKEAEYFQKKDLRTP